MLTINPKIPSKNIFPLPSPSLKSNIPSQNIFPLPSPSLNPKIPSQNIFPLPFLTLFILKTSALNTCSPPPPPFS